MVALQILVLSVKVRILVVQLIYLSTYHFKIMNLKKILDSYSETIPAQIEPNLTKQELINWLAKKFNVAKKNIKLIKFGKTEYHFYVLVDKSVFDGYYKKPNGAITHLTKRFRVNYLVETPGGYGGGVSSMYVEAETEDEAKTEARKVFEANNSGNGRFAKSFWVVPPTLDL